VGRAAAPAIDGAGIRARATNEQPGKILSPTAPALRENDAIS